MHGSHLSAFKWNILANVFVAVDTITLWDRKQTKVGGSRRSNELPHLLSPFLKLGNVIGFFLVLLLHIFTL